MICQQFETLPSESSNREPAGGGACRNGARNCRRPRGPDDRAFPLSRRPHRPGLHRLLRVGAAPGRGVRTPGAAEQGAMNRSSRHRRTSGTANGAAQCGRPVRFGKAPAGQISPPFGKSLNSRQNVSVREKRGMTSGWPVEIDPRSQRYDAGRIDHSMTAVIWKPTLRYRPSYAPKR